MINRCKNYLFVVLLSLMPSVLLAQSIGDAADNVLISANFLTRLVYALCYAIGIGLLVGSALQYNTYRKNPTQIKKSQPIALFFFGLLLILLPIISQLSESSESVGLGKQPYSVTNYT